VAFDLGKEVTSEEEKTLSNSILLSPRKHQLRLASAADETAATSSISNSESDNMERVLEVLAPQKTKTTKRAKAKAETTPRKTTGKRRRSAPERTSGTVFKRRRTSYGDAEEVTDDESDEGQEMEDERLARCHPEIAELFSAIGLNAHIPACADKVRACA
jgi:hypothetical protein